MLEKRLFVKGMNGDMEDRLVQPGEYRYALNCRAGVSDNDNTGVVENVKGNSLVSTSLPSGTNTCIGTHECKICQKIYYFVHNTENSHAVYEYDIKANSIRVILQTSQFNFQLDHLITGVNLIDGKLLYWTDNYNEPRSIDVTRAFASSNSDLTEQYISAIKYAPLKPPTAQYVTINTLSKLPNALYGNLWQFRIQYVYINDQKSAWSPISKVPLPTGEFDIFLDKDVRDKNNAINVFYDIGNELVKQVNIAVRDGNSGVWLLAEQDVKRDNGKYTFTNNEIYSAIDVNEANKLYDAVPKLAGAQEIIDGNRLAYGNVLDGFDPHKQWIQLENVFQPADDLPQSFIVNENYLSLWSYAFNVEKIAFSTDSSNTSVSINEDIARYTDSTSNFVQENAASVVIDNQVVFFDFFGSHPERTFQPTSTQYPPKVGDTISIKLKAKSNDGNSNLNPSEFIHNVTAQDDEDSIMDALVNSINSYTQPQFYDGTKSYNPFFAEKYNSPDFPIGTTPLATFNAPVLEGIKVTIKIDPSSPAVMDENDLTQPKPGSVLGSDSAKQWDRQSLTSWFGAYSFVTEVTKGSHSRGGADASEIMCFKAGARHKVGIVYSDHAGRLSTIQQVANAEIPWFSEMPSGEEGPMALDLTINFGAPEWAKKYHLVYAPRQDVGRYLQVVTGLLEQDEGKPALSITPTTTEYRDRYPNNILSYEWSPGDRIRFIRKPNNDWYKDYVDLEILKLTLDNQLILGSFAENINLDLSDLADGHLAEIYSPRKNTDEVLFYEIGESYDIYDGPNGEKWHRGNTDASIPGQDQNGGQPAIVTLRNQGDSFWRRRRVGASPNQTPDLAIQTYDTYVEDRSFSDFYIAEDYHIGRPNVVDKSAAETRRVATIFYSEPYVFGTKINGLSNFFLLSFEEYDENYGSIQRLYSEDKKLIAFQELKVGQILVNEITYKDLSGGSTIGASSQVLSTMIYYAGEYGIAKNPESFAVYGNRKYFTDINRGTVLRLSTDGITPISEKNMHNYFTDKFDEQSALDNPVLLGVYDKRFDEYVLSIKQDIQIEFATESIGIEDRGGTLLVDQNIIDPDLGGFKLENYSPELDDCLRFGVPITLTVLPNERGALAGDITYSIIDSYNIGEDTYVRISGFNPVDNNGNGALDFFARYGVCNSADTIAFCEPKKVWTSFYSFAPDFMSSAITNIATWKNGKLYVHNSSVAYNNFYGVQYDSRIQVISNEDPSKIKFYLAIQEESTTPWTMLEGTNQYGQKTNLIEEDFETIEGHHYAPFWKDENTPNIDNPLIEGDHMRSYTMSLLLVNESPRLEKLFSVGIRQEGSELSNK
jgi:hypothetical protein